MSKWIPIFLCFFQLHAADIDDELFPGDYHTMNVIAPPPSPNLSSSVPNDITLTTVLIYNKLYQGPKTRPRSLSSPVRRQRLSINSPRLLRPASPEPGNHNYNDIHSPASPRSMEMSSGFSLVNSTNTNTLHSQSFSRGTDRRPREYDIKPVISEKTSMRRWKKCCIFTTLASVFAGALTAGLTLFPSQKLSHADPCFSVKIDQCSLNDQSFEFDNICSFNNSCRNVQNRIEELCSPAGAIHCLNSPCSPPCDSLQQIENYIKEPVDRLIPKKKMYKKKESFDV